VRVFLRCTFTCVFALLSGGVRGQFYDQFRSTRAGGAGRNSRRADDVSFHSCCLHAVAGSILSVESSQNVESKTKNVESKTDKCGVQNSIWSVDSQENH